MGVRTRLGIMSLTGNSGSIELPENITLLCPQCNTKVADKGQCLAELVGVPNGAGFALRIVVDCRSCGCYGNEPLIL